MPLVILLFGAVWLFPLITALVAGDIFASEDHNGTLKTILTRSLERWQIFAGKALAAATYAVVAIFCQRDGGGHRGQHPVGLQLGADAVGDDRVRPEGTRARVPQPARLPDPDRDRRVHRAAALDDHAQQRGGRGRDADDLAAVPADRDPAGAGRAQPYLLSTQFNAWQGLLRQPIDWSPIVRAAWVCALYGVPALATAFLVFLRRDVAGG